MRDDRAPGLRRVKRATGEAWYWVAADCSRHAVDYPVKTVRLHYNTHEERIARCRQLSADLHEWLAGRADKPVFLGTIQSLINCYQTAAGSPFHDVKANTRADYAQRLTMIGRYVGARRVDHLNRADFVEWHRRFLAPKDGGAPRIRTAHGLMAMIRIILGFGISMRYPGCAETAAVLSEIRFKTPKPRRQALTFEQAAAVVEEALSRGRSSIALGQALQFELALRQADVIGQWFPHDGRQQGVLYRGERWAGGLLWWDLGASGILTKETTKTGAVGEWDLARCPLVQRALTAFPAAERIGPMIISEETGLPYLDKRYSRTWRRIANAAGLPADLWNRDSRAGAITEGWDAGADIKDLQRQATHSNPAMTQRYARNALASTSKVADLRTARRAKKQP